ncbi:MAG: hypothetical protein LBB36_04335 [Fibromonadaceae bacterium]|nr:hypothetical protein [Fibromonadaceae bacterium]
MNKIKISVFIAISAMFFACGSQDGSPAKLKNEKVGFISPFDTLIAEFDSKIVDIDKLNEENIIASNMILIIEQKSSNKLKLIGADTTPGGLHHFKPNINKEDSIVFLNLQNDDGYTQKRAVLYYSTYPVLGGENNKETNPDTLKNLGLGTITDEVIFAGTIGINPKSEWTNLNDNFILPLKAYDSLYVTLSNISNNARLELIAQEKTFPSVEDSKNKTKSIKYEMDPRDFNVPDWETQIPFKIKVASIDSLAPYMLKVKVVEYRREQ